MIGKRLIGAVSLATLLFLILPFILQPPAPNNREAARERITSDRERGRDVQTLYQIQALAAEDGWTPDLLQLAGDSWHNLGDLTRALPYWEAADQQMPDDPALTRTLAEAYLELQRWPQATDVLDRLVNANPDDAWAHFNRGVLGAAFNPRAAADDLRTASQHAAYQALASRLLRIVDGQGAADPLVGMRVGMALAGVDEWPYAELAFQQAADVGQAYPEVLAYVGLSRDRQGKDGSESIAQAVALDSSNAVVRYIQGLHLRGENDLAGSLNALIEAVRLDPENPAYYAELGTAYQLTGDLENAERWLRVAADASHQDARFQQLLEAFYAQEAPRLAEGSMSDPEMVATLMPDDPDVQAGVGWALYQSGQTEAAVRQLDAVLEVVSDHPRALFYKARIAFDNDQPDEARQFLERLVRQNSPFQAQAQQLLDSLGVAG